MSANNKLILAKSLAEQMLRNPNITKAATSQEIEILRNFLEDNATIADARRATKRIKTVLKAE